ncbi:MAG: dTDP-4-dehydrorhamnose 3,5-epimerase [Denitrovibrio sp.]|nr:MAG: dTDP-4-dehydrorhamnose 3,5-epimerase [Denitrovibrio sp.]
MGNKLNIKKLPLLDSFLITPNSFKDDRGFFARVYCTEELSSITDKPFLQVNQSLSYKKGTVRGMHFQHPPHSEIKIVKCISGSIFDVIIDIRKNSPTFLQWHGEVLSRKNMNMLYVPEGFAHGFQALTDDCEILYFNSQLYAPESEGILNAKDPSIGIDWPDEITTISDKDSNAPYITNFNGLYI